MYHSFLIHSFTDGQLGCFWNLAIVNCAAMNIGVHKFFWIGVSGLWRYNPSSGIARSKGSSIFCFLNSVLFSSGVLFWGWPALGEVALHVYGESSTRNFWVRQEVSSGLKVVVGELCPQTPLSTTDESKSTKTGSAWGGKVRSLKGEGPRVFSSMGFYWVQFTQEYRWSLLIIVRQ